MSSASLYVPTESLWLNKELEWPLCYAVEHNYESALLTIFTNIKNPSAVVYMDDIVKSFLIACERGYVTVVETLLKHGNAEFLQKCNKHKCNCLHTACRAGNFEMVKLLCEYASKELPKQTWKKVINWKSEEAKTPLMFAIEAKHVDIVKYLLEFPDIKLDSQTKKGQNVVQIAARYSLECLKALQSSPHVSFMHFLDTDKEGWGILHRACAGGNVDRLKWIMDLRRAALGGLLTISDDGYSNAQPLWSRDKLNEKTKKGYTPLLVACEYQHKDMVEYLLSLPDVDSSASTSMDGSGEGNTGLHIAAIHDSPEIAKLLIDRCPTTAINKEGDTALHIARRKSSFDVFDILSLKDAGLQEIPNKNGQKADDIEPEEVIPPEIRKRGHTAVNAFRKALREGKQKISPLCKLLVLGEARVGKTSLVRHMTGCEFICDLKPTHGIKNECITTMVDSANIDMSNWRTISESEQAERNQEHSISAIIKAVDPGILATGDNPNNVRAEPQISEAELLNQINKLFNAIRIAVPTKMQETNNGIKRQKNDSKENFQTVSKFSVSTISSVMSQSTPPPYTKISPPPSEHQKANINSDQIINHALPKPTPRKKKNPNKGTSIKPEPVNAPDAAHSEPQKIEPVIAKVHKCGLGRRSVQDVGKRLFTVPQMAQESSLCLQVLDFAGQKEYRPMHHCFMSRRAIYTVVFNLQHLCDPEEKKKTFSDVKYWLNSIHAHVHISGYKYEKYIFLVGTHKDPGNGKRVITDYDIKIFSSELQEYLFTSHCPFKNGIHFFRPSDHDLIMTGLENSMDQSKSGIEFFTKEIEEFSKYLPFAKETYPITWLSFKDKLLKTKVAGSPLLKIAEATKIARDCGVEDVHTALQLFHDIGVIIYPAVLKSIYLEQLEKDHISTDILVKPTWLISVMTEVMEVSMSHAILENEDIDTLRKTGMASMAFLRKLWQDYHKDDEDLFKKICLLMRAHGLMQAIMSTDIRFIIPCMLSQKEQNFPIGYTFYFDFKGFLPQEVFHCLICLVIKTCQEVPDCSPPEFSANSCIWYSFKGYDWCIQPMSETHRLKVVARPRKKKKPDDLTPLECISFLHEKYIHPICEQSGLPGLTYIAGPMVEACVEADPPHKVGVLAAVCYPESGSNGLKTSGRCPTCREEYDIKEVLHQTYPSKETDKLADQLCNMVITDKECHSPMEKMLKDNVQQHMEVHPGSFQTSIVDAPKRDKSNDTVVSLPTAGGSGGAPIEDIRNDRRQSEGMVDFKKNSMDQLASGSGGASVEDIRRRSEGGANDFNNVSEKQLGEDELTDVMEEVMDITAKWKLLGLALRLKAAELDTISSKNHIDPTECLRDMLLAWLQQRYDFKKFGPPSWRMLCQAISKSAGGNNPALASKLAKLHQL